MLKIEHLQKQYKNFSLDCSLEVKPGMITGLIGKNGAGKTTIFKIIMGLIFKDGGRISIFGKNVEKEISVEDKKKVRVAFADSGFNDYLNINDCADIMETMYQVFDRRFFMDQCRRLSIPENKTIKEFSTGMKAKLKVVSVLSSNASLLILDEPTVGLDVIARESILDLIREYMENNENAAIIISSHIASDIETLCDDIYMIDNGHIILHEDTDVLLSDYGILKVTADRLVDLDQKYLLKIKKESYGYCCLTNQKQYYLENNPDIVIENSGIDDLLLMMNGGIKNEGIA